jgi:hypothetical protein
MKKYELWTAFMGKMPLSVFNRCFRLYCQAVKEGQVITDAEGWIKSQARIEKIKEGTK